MAERARAHRLWAVELSDDSCPRIRADRPPVYVGTTTMSPAERYRSLDRSRRYASIAPHVVRPRPDLVRAYPATTQADARRQLAKLKRRLKRRGFVVNGEAEVYRVYVVELADSVGPKTGNPALPWVYVGETALPVEQRFRQHLEGATNGRGRLASRVVQEHGLRLRPDLVAHVAPVHSREDSRRLEARIAEQLGARGYSVKGGH